MALVTCPECGREKVSDTAVACPECGYEIRKHFNNPIYQVREYAICPVCGFSMNAKLIKDCRHCGYKHENLHIIPFQLKEWNELIKSDEYHDYVKNLSSGELFNEELFQQTFTETRRKTEYNKKLMEDYNKVKASNRVSCPYCSSYNVRKIGMTGRLVSTSLFGLGSKKVGKQWHCNNCKSDF